MSEQMKCLQFNIAKRLRELADNIEQSDHVYVAELGEHHLTCEFATRESEGPHEAKIVFESSPS